MTRPIAIPVIAAWMFAACGAGAQQPIPAQRAAMQEMPQGKNVNPDAGMVADFNKRIDAYVKIRKAAGESAPDLERTNKPQEIVTAESSLARNIRAARASAKQGDIFTPATQAMFRRLLKPPLAKGADAADNKAIIKDDAPKRAEVPFKINGNYPKDVALSTVPPDVLRALPQLPEDVQYRFVGRHLILYDAKANLIIDYMLNAMP